MKIIYNEEEDFFDSYDSYESKELKEWDEIEKEEAAKMKKENEERDKHLSFVKKQEHFTDIMREMLKEQGYDTDKYNLLKS